MHGPVMHSFHRDAAGELRLWDLTTRRSLLARRVHAAGPGGVLGISASTSLYNKVLSAPLTLVCSAASQGRDGIIKCWQLVEGGLSEQPLATVRTGSYNFCRLSVLWQAAPSDGNNPAAEGARDPFIAEQNERQKAAAPAAAASLTSTDTGTSTETAPRCSGAGGNSEEHNEPRGGVAHKRVHGGGLSVLLNSAGKVGAASEDKSLSVQTSSSSPCSRLSGKAPLFNNCNTHKRLLGGLPALLCGSAVPDDEACGTILVAVAGSEPSIVSVNMQLAEIWDVHNGDCVAHIRHTPASGSSPASTDAGGPQSSGAGTSADMCCCASLGSPYTDQVAAGMCMAVELRQWPSMAGQYALVAGYEDGSVGLWDLRDVSSPIATVQISKEPVLALSVDSKCAGGLAGSAGEKAAFFTMNAAEGTASIVREVAQGRPGIADTAIRGDDRLAATAGWDHRVRIYDYKRQRPLAILKYHSAEVTGLAFSPDGALLASSSRDATIALWSVYPPHS
eukprot:SM000146S00964  [mRNA]  locus=s146:170304:173474:- [translate_table: standard]